MASYLSPALSKTCQRILVGGALTFVSLPSIAHAYVGPGAGLTAIGTALALIAAVALALVGFVWYPFKRLMKRRKETDGAELDPASGAELNK